jgi:hypothetical protein
MTLESETKPRSSITRNIPASGVPGDPKKLLIETAQDFALIAVGLLLFSIILNLYIRNWLLS